MTRAHGFPQARQRDDFKRPLPILALKVSRRRHWRRSSEARAPGVRPDGRTLRALRLAAGYYVSYRARSSQCTAHPCGAGESDSGCGTK